MVGVFEQWGRAMEAAVARGEISLATDLNELYEAWMSSWDVRESRLELT